MLDVDYEVEFYSINGIEDIHTGNKDTVYDVDINNPHYGRYNMAKVTEQEYGTSSYYLLLTPYCTEPPEPPTLSTLFAYLLAMGALRQEHKPDVYRVTATGETMTVGEWVEHLEREVLENSTGN